MRIVLFGIALILMGCACDKKPEPPSLEAGIIIDSINSGKGWVISTRDIDYWKSTECVEDKETGIVVVIQPARLDRERVFGIPISLSKSDQERIVVAAYQFRDRINREIARKQLTTMIER